MSPQVWKVQTGLAVSAGTSVCFRLPLSSMARAGSLQMCRSIWWPLELLLQILIKPASQLCRGCQLAHLMFLTDRPETGVSVDEK